MQEIDKIRDQVLEGHAFKFCPVTPNKPCMFMLTPSGGYLNAPATKKLNKAGKYVEILVDPNCQVLKLRMHDKSGAGRYRIFQQSGASIQVRQKLGKMGMICGTYLYIGALMFQHIDYIK